MALPVTYTFFGKAMHRGEKISQIDVRAPTMRDLKILHQADNAAARLAKMIELLTGMTAREVDDLEVEDVVELGEIVARFFPNSKRRESS